MEGDADDFFADILIDSPADNIASPTLDNLNIEVYISCFRIPLDVTVEFYWYKLES